VPLTGETQGHSRTLLKPYGVFAVIAPFNFPFALATGMITGALLGGNTVIFKPASPTSWTGVALKTVLQEVGVKPEASWMLAEGSDAALFVAAAAQQTFARLACAFGSGQ